AVACIDHPVVREMVQRLNLRADGRRLLTYGQSEDADLRLTAVRIIGNTTYFDASLAARVKGGARVLHDWSVPVPGAHN
ncbi:MAG TPA: UDP-N-acetylmuramate--L-alanine ligase, partial [Hyphomicrobium sp.]|nr:UDP-N-acetylmuramate--L-alanine ligase [Hyphomicrobium sp.]